MDKENDSIEHYVQYFQNARIYEDGNNIINHTNKANKNINISSINTAIFDSCPKVSAQVDSIANYDENQDYPNRNLNSNNKNIKETLFSLTDKLFESNPNNPNNINSEINDIIIQKEKKDMEEIDILQDKIERLKFQTEINKHKQNNYENTMERLNVLQKEKENKYIILSSEFKEKENILRKKYREKEDEMLREIKKNEENYEKQIKKLKNELEKLEGKNSKLNKDFIESDKKNNILIEKLTQKENELQQQLFLKNSDIKNLQEQLSQIEGQNLEIDEENEGKMQELNQEIIELRALQTQIYYNNRNKNKYKFTYNEPITPSSKQRKIYNNQNLIYNIQIQSKKIGNIDLEESNGIDENQETDYLCPYDIIKSKELKDKIRVLQREIMDFTKELSLKNQENDSLTEEISRLKNECKNYQMEQLFKNRTIGSSEQNYDYGEEENRKIDYFEKIINNYGKTIEELNNSYNLKLKENQKEIIDITNSYEEKIKQLNNEIEKMSNKINSNSE